MEKEFLEYEARLGKQVKHYFANYQAGVIHIFRGTVWGHICYVANFLSLNNVYDPYAITIESIVNTINPEIVEEILEKNICVCKHVTDEFLEDNMSFNILYYIMFKLFFVMHKKAGRDLNYVDCTSTDHKLCLNKIFRSFERTNTIGCGSMLKRIFSSDECDCIDKICKLTFDDKVRKIELSHRYCIFDNDEIVDRLSRDPYGYLIEIGKLEEIDDKVQNDYRRERCIVSTSFIYNDMYLSYLDRQYLILSGICICEHLRSINVASLDKDHIICKTKISLMLPLIQTHMSMSNTGTVPSICSCSDYSEYCVRRLLKMIDDFSPYRENFPCIEDDPDKNADYTLSDIEEIYDSDNICDLTIKELNDFVDEYHYLPFSINTPNKIYQIALKMDEDMIILYIYLKARLDEITTPGYNEILKTLRMSRSKTGKIPV